MVENYLQSEGGLALMPPLNGSFNVQDAEAAIEGILNAIADPVFIKDGDGCWQFVNQAFCELIGCSAEELIGRSERDLLSEAEASCFLQADHRVLENHQNFEHEATLTDVRGTEHHLRIRRDLFHGQQGQPMVVGTVRDITERYQVEVKLHQQEERERLLGAIAQHLLQALNPEQMLQATVNEVRRFLKADRVLFFSFDPEYRGIVAESVADGVPSLMVNSLEEIYLTPENLNYYQQVSVLAVEDFQAQPEKHPTGDLAALRVRALLVIPIVQGDTLYGFVCAHHCCEARCWREWEIDTLKEVATQVGSAIKQARLYKKISELNSALEQQIDQRSEQLHTALEFEATLRRISERVRDSLDEKQIILTALKEVTEALGVKGSNTALYDLEQGTSTIYYEYNRSLPSYQGRVAQMEAFPEVYTQLLQGQYFQFCSKEPNPVRGHVSMLACPILDDRGVLGDLWLINDKDYGFQDMEIRLVQQVSNQCAIAIRQARLYQAAQMQVEQLERLNHLKDDFLSTVSHELRTPVTSMRVALQLLGVTLNQELDLDAELKKSKTDQTRIARYYQILQEECEREISLINDLLDLQRLDVGNHPIQPEPISLENWLPGLVNGFIARAKDRDQILTLNVPPGTPVIHTDLASLERILAELLNNACKYTPPGETIQLDVLPHRDRNEAQVQFRLTNTGVVIPEQEIARIFDKFYRVPSADPWKQGGTGLGLALVQKLVQHLGGDISVESAFGETCFMVTLPRCLVLPISS